MQAIQDVSEVLDTFERLRSVETPFIHTAQEHKNNSTGQKGCNAHLCAKGKFQVFLYLHCKYNPFCFSRRCVGGFRTHQEFRTQTINRLLYLLSYEM